MKRAFGRKSRQAGITLLEVILSMAILAGAVATLGEVLRNGMRNAQSAGDLTRAQLLCENKMAEIMAEIDLPSAVSQTALESEDVISDTVAWLYAVEVEQIDGQYLVSLSVTVEQDLEPERHPASFTLVRWVFDPEHLIELEQEELEAEEAAAGGLASGGGSG